MSPVSKAKAISRNNPGPPRLPEEEAAVRWDPLGLGAAVFSSQICEAGAAVIQSSGAQNKELSESKVAVRTDELAPSTSASVLARPLSQAVPVPNILAIEVQRIQAAQGWREVLDRPSTLKCARHHYRQIMLRLHSHEREQAAERVAGGEDACIQVCHRVQEAYAVASTELPWNLPSDGFSNTEGGINPAVPVLVAQ